MDELSYNINERQQADFNMAVSSLNRINVSLIICNECQRQKDLAGWFYEQLILFKEASTEMSGDIYKVLGIQLTKEQKKAVDDEFEYMRNLTKRLEPLVFNFTNNNAPITTRELFMNLLNMEIFLRKILKDAGLLMKMKDDARFALGR